MDLQPNYKGLQKTLPTDLTVGMYIAQLDRPWEETNSPLQGFYVRNQSIVERIAEACAFVFIDPRRYDAKLGEVKLTAVPDIAQKFGATVTRLSARERLIPKQPQAYENTVSIGDEVPAATASLTEAEEILSYR